MLIDWLGCDFCGLLEIIVLSPTAHPPTYFVDQKNIENKRNATSENLKDRKGS